MLASLLGTEPLDLREASGSRRYEVFFSWKDSSEGIALGFLVRGAIEALQPGALPPVRPRPGRDLWKRTCFEAFFFESASERYVELNWNLAGEYALLTFDGYRRESAAAPELEVSDILRAVDTSRLESRIDLRLPSERPYLLSPTAILMPSDSPPLHYALAHGDRPDFHRREVVRDVGLVIGAPPSS